MAILFVMVGIPGSGKSTYAKAFGCPIVSTDAIREELFGSASVQTCGDKVFKIAYKRLHEYLDAGHDVVFDAMNLKRKDRKYLIKNYPNCKHIAVFVNTPLCVCLDRNAKRDRVVPEKVIMNKFLKLQEPKEYEGFDVILEINSGDLNE